jgi:ABC-type multidrug transport system fused ATPase/permease subunit
MLSQPLTNVMARTSQETLYALTNGVMNITLGVIGSSVSLIADFSLLLVLFVGLLVVDPVVAMSTIALFSGIGLLLYKLLHNKAQELGKSQALLTVESNERIVEIVHGFREAAVKNRRGYYANEISKLRFALSRDLAESAFLPYIGKYVIETTVILGALAISAVQFAISDAAHAVSTLSVFLAAGTRIAPAVLRMQQGGIQLKSALGSALPTIELIEELSSVEIKTILEDSKPKFDYSGFNARVKVQGVSYRYPGKEVDALKEISFEISDGEFVALVGSSGAGKSTLADLILGLLIPNSGEIRISGEDPTIAISRWPGALSYVPQEVLITNGSIFENVALGYEPKDVSRENVARAIKLSQLDDLVAQLPEGLETRVGERGAKLSGGQRQRLGIARALYTNPRLLVLDEATSALDGKTESDISQAITALKRKVTVIMIAHRLSTVREADKIVYLESGRIVAIGDFGQVRERVPEFDEQARLMGL